MSGLTIIHLSDLHIATKSSDHSPFALADFTAENLGNDFREVATKHSIPFRPEETFLVVTGDITCHHEWPEYEVAIHFVRKLRAQFAQRLQTDELPGDHVICIPGNHDIEVPEKTPADTAIQRKIKYRNFKLFLEEVTDYSAFAKKFKLDNPFVNMHTPVPFGVQMLDLNTTLNITCHSKSEPGSKPCLSLDHLKILDDLLSMRNDAVQIALMHHPLSDFPSEDSPNGLSQDRLRDWLISRSVELVLCGHIHQASGTGFTPVLEDKALLELGTGYSFLMGKLLGRGNHYQVIRIEQSDDNPILLVRRNYAYVQGEPLLSPESGHWEPEEGDRPVVRLKIPKLMDRMGETDYRSFIGIRSQQDWAVVAHCNSRKFRNFGVLSPGEQVNAVLLEISGYTEGKLDRVNKDSQTKWEKYSQKVALFLVDSPHYNPYVRWVLTNSGTYLAGRVVQFVDIRGERPVLQRIHVHGETFMSNKSEGMRLFDEFADYLLIMRLPGFVPIVGDTQVEVPDIDRSRVIWVVAGIHSKSSHAGAMLFVPRNFQLFVASLQEKCQGSKLQYFEAVYKAPSKPERIDDFNRLQLVHFGGLRLKSEIGMADELPSGVAVRFLDEKRWGTIPISTVHFDPVAACNFNCQKCIEKDVRRMKRFLSMSACARILCDLRDNGCQNLNFYGGEPTLHPDFDTILRLSSNLGFHMLLVTNGSQLVQGGIAKVIVNNRDKLHVRVSIDAHTKESHRRNHGLASEQDYFTDIVRCTEQLIKQGVSVSISYLLHKDSIAEILEACRFWGQNHASALILRPVTKKSGRSPELGYSQDEKALFRRALDEHPGFVFAPAWFQEWISENNPLGKQKRCYDRCYSGYYRIAISPSRTTDNGRTATVKGIELTETDDAWISLCTYRRYETGYGCEYPPDLKTWCQEGRQEAMERIKPARHCQGIICCRHEYNKQIHDLMSSSFQD